MFISLLVHVNPSSSTKYSGRVSIVLQHLTSQFSNPSVFWDVQLFAHQRGAGGQWNDLLSRLINGSSDSLIVLPISFPLIPDSGSGFLELVVAGADCAAPRWEVADSCGGTDVLTASPPRAASVTGHKPHRLTCQRFQRQLKLDHLTWCVCWFLLRQTLFF